MIRALATHWPEYLIEGALLGLFMISACVSVAILEHPRSPARRAIPSPFRRRALVGLAMGVTAAALIYSPWGQRSGAHMNPAFTLAFLWLGKIAPWDAIFYVFAQVAGGLAGVALSAGVLRGVVRHESVNYVVTVPGPRGVRTAWTAEFAISMGLMLAVLIASNLPAAAPFTGLLAASLVALYITFEAPLSGMSINPARTIASAVPARCYRGLWVYLTAPPAAMIAGAALYTGVLAHHEARCAKLNHGDRQCIFRCGYAESPERPAPARRIEAPASAAP